MSLKDTMNIGFSDLTNIHLLVHRSILTYRRIILGKVNALSIFNRGHVADFY